jgi:branched-chain amino acid transport system ATP-binding protein
MSAPAATRSLRVERLTSGYGEVTVLRSVSLEVAPGEIVAILGANGAGKTTLLRTVVGLLRPKSGTVEAHGVDITGVRTEKITRQRVVLVPEGRQLFHSMTVLENLILGGYTQPRSERGANMDRVFDLFPILKERQSQKASSLSGGQRQMVALGRALMARPMLLLLDEPSLGLAPLVIKETFDTLARLRDEGVTILIVEQNAAMTLALADRGYVLTRGRVSMHGPAAELAADPRVQQAYLGHRRMPVREPGPGPGDGRVDRGALSSPDATGSP